MKNYVYVWWSEGIYMIPPPCMYCHCLRRCLSNNGIFLSISHFGYEWAHEKRSQIMFVGFWLSLCSLFLMVAPFLSLFSADGLVQSNSWTNASVHYPENVDIQLDYFIGLRRVVGLCVGMDCPADVNWSFMWGDDRCQTFGGGCHTDACVGETNNVCDDCAASAYGTIVLAATGAVSVVPQMIVNLERSSIKGDLPCAKILGAWASGMGVVTTLLTLSSYLNYCYTNMPPEIGGRAVDYRLGVSFWCTLLATFLKLWDFVFNMIIPVPRHGFWGEGMDGDIHEVTMDDLKQGLENVEHAVEHGIESVEHAAQSARDDAAALIADETAYVQSVADKIDSAVGLGNSSTYLSVKSLERSINESLKSLETAVDGRLRRLSFSPSSLTRRSSASIAPMRGVSESVKETDEGEEV